jgi:hypothetical protein
MISNVPESQVLPWSLDPGESRAEDAAGGAGGLRGVGEEVGGAEGASGVGGGRNGGERKD